MALPSRIHRRCLILIVAGASWFCARGLHAAMEEAPGPSSPLVIAKNARTEKDVLVRQKAWVARILVKPATARIAAHKEAAWAPEALNFLKAVPVPLLFEPDYQPETTLGVQARELVAAGCEEPTVLLLAALIDGHLRTDWQFTADCLKRIDQTPAAARAPLSVLVFHKLMLEHDSLESGGFQEESRAMEPRIIEALVKMSSDGSFLPGEAELFFYQIYLYGKFCDAHAAALKEVTPRLGLPAWARLTFLGDAEVHLAWQARPGGWTGFFTIANGWPEFCEHMAAARKALTAAWKKNPKCPIAPSRMITVVMGRGPAPHESERTWFDRAIAAQADYAPAYQLLLRSCKRRWGGSWGLMLAFGKACLATGRYDLKLPVVYIRACDMYATEFIDGGLVFSIPQFAATVMEISEATLQEPSQASNREFWLSELALNAWLCGDSDRAGSALAALGGPLKEATLKRMAPFRLSEAALREKVPLAAAQTANDLAPARELFKTGKLNEAEKLLRFLPPKSPETARQAIELQHLISIEQELATGHWVTLPIEPGLAGWTQKGGSFSVKSRGVLIIRGTDTEGYLIHKARIGPDFELRAHFSTVGKSKCCAGCGFAFGYDPGRDEGFNAITWTQDGHRAPVTFVTERSGSIGKAIKGGTLQPVNVLELQSGGDKLTLTANGPPTVSDYPVAGFNRGSKDSQVGIGHYRWCRSNITEITKIEVRRLMPPAP